MKLAIKVYFATLILLTLAFATFAQSDAISVKDPRNTAPTVGTGGSIGGPTGLFTVYDGHTLRKGEFTFSFAVSNYDRDPGNVDITSLPTSFQVGLTNHVELFFSTEMARQIKVNSPRNLSGFYLPNSQFVIPGFGLTRAPAIVLSPQGPGASQYPNQAIYRPTGAPFVQFPYSGGNAGTFGLQAPFFSGPIFGFAAGTNALLGPPRLGGNGAANFPGIGSIYGSILPGIVLQSTSLVNQAGLPAGEGPLVFTLKPSYLPDAPFLNRQFGESSFNEFNIGVKWRLSGLNSPIGFGFMAAYTWNADNANSTTGFNMLQRGASGGGNMGDITAGLFADARLAKWANLSANVAYKYTSAAKGEFPGGTFTLLDRPDELASSIGVDFPVNKWFQPIAEFRSLMYVGGRTPNAFENNPIDGLVGARVFITRYAGLGFAYRYNFNQQSFESFNKTQAFTGSVLVPCRPGVTNCAPVTITNTFTGIPAGFAPSTDPNGYIFQFWLGRRNKRAEDVINQSPNISGVNLSTTVIKIGCLPGFRSTSGKCDDSRSVSVATSASDPENDVLTYNYTVSGGRVVGTGANVQWDLSGANEGTYTITTGVDDGCGVCGKTNTQTVTIKKCDDCVQVCNCPSLSVNDQSGVTSPGSTMTFTLNGGGSNPVNWSVTAGTIESGQGTSTITVRVPAEGSPSNITATASLGGLDEACRCPNTAQGTGGVAPKLTGRLVDEFGTKKDDEVKAIVDNFYIELNNDPNAKGYIVIYGNPKQIAHRKAQIMKAINFRKYPLDRVIFVDGGDNGQGEYTKLWFVPAGADAPGK